MEVILLEDHPHLGQRGDVVNVTKGYARNYLFPKKLAILSSPSGRATFEAEEQFHKREVKKERQAAESLKEELDGIQISIGAKAGNEGKLYGSITNKDISEVLKKKGYVIDRRNMKLTKPIKDIGIYDIEISLFQDVKAYISLLVEETDG